MPPETIDIFVGHDERALIQASNIVSFLRSKGFKAHRVLPKKARYGYRFGQIGVRVTLKRGWTRWRVTRMILDWWEDFDVPSEKWARRWGPRPSRRCR